MTTKETEEEFWARIEAHCRYSRMVLNKALAMYADDPVFPSSYSTMGWTEGGGKYRHGTKKK